MEFEDDTKYKKWLTTEAERLKQLEEIRKKDKPVDYSHMEVKMPFGCWIWIAIAGWGIGLLLFSAFRGCVP